MDRFELLDKLFLNHAKEMKMLERTDFDIDSVKGDILTCLKDNMSYNDAEERIYAGYLTTPTLINYSFFHIFGIIEISIIHNHSCIA